MIVGAMMLLSVLQAIAGQKLDLRDITRNEFRQETMKAVTPLAGGDTYAQISDDGRRIVAYSFKTGKQVGVLFDAATARGQQVSRVDGYIVSPDGKRLLIQTETKSIYRRSFTATYYIFTIQNNKLEPLSEGGPQQTPMFSPDGNVIAFVRDNNIYLVKLLYDNAESQVTKDGKRNEVINGIPDWVYEEEFSYNSAMTFTANSEQLVWVRFDESQVKQYSMQLFKGLAPEREEFRDYPGEYTYKYPVPGEVNAKVQVMSYDIKSHQTRTLQLPLDADGYIPRVKATSDPAKVCVVTLNRHQDDLKVYMCNPLSTVCQMIIEDKVDKYVKEETLEQLQITDKHVVLTSERDGYNHIYVYNLNGQLMRSVGGSQIVTDVYGLDEQTGDIYFAALNDDPTDQQVFVTHSNGKTDSLTPKKGWNSAIFSKDFKSFILTWSDMQTPSVFSLCNNQGKVLTTLIDNKTLKQKYDSYDMGTKEFFTFTTAENVKLYGYMVKPKDFNPAKKYPVIMVQYSGPGSQLVLNRWALDWEEYAAMQGYIVACVDGRGTGGRGWDFEHVVYQRLGHYECIDQIAASDYMASLPYVDKDRIGMWGWSYGGFMTLMAMSTPGSHYKCGVAIAPVTSWKYYDTIYTERYMRTPQLNPEGYKNGSPLEATDKLKGRVLIMFGSADDNVHIVNEMQYISKLESENVDFDMHVWTNMNHSINGCDVRLPLYRKVMNFFDQNLKK